MNMFSNLTQILSYEYAGNALAVYIWALAVFVLSLIVLKIFKNVVVKKLKKIGNHIRISFYDLIIKLIESIDWFFYVFLSLYFSFQFIHLPSGIEKFVSYATIIIIAYYAVKLIQSMLDYGTDRIVQKGKKGDKKFDYSVIKFSNKIIKIILWALAVLIVMQNLGYNVSALLAGVGIGGIAIAIALQNVLSDTFAAFSIYFDKPFQTGDFIIIGEDMGTVKNIGIKSTRIKTLQGQELIIPNKELTETRVHNYKKMKKRRVVFGFGVTYETSTEKLKKIPTIVKKIFKEIELTKLDRVHFSKFNDFSLDFEVVYYIKESDYNVYMDIQQEINLAIKERFEQKGIEMAYPTQTLYVSRIK